jgi:serine/threonine protein kinase
MIPVKKISSEMANALVNTGKNKMCKAIETFYCDGKDCDNLYTITDLQIGEKSINGVVYQACLLNDCSYIAKWQKNPVTAISEAQTQQEAAKKGLAPYVHQAWTCDEGAIIIMDAMSIAVSRILKSLTQEQLAQTIKNNTDKFKRSGIIFDEKAIRSIEDLRKTRSLINTTLYRQGKNPLGDIETVQDTDQQMDTRKKTVSEVFNLLDKLHSIGIEHGDAHLNNFMADSDMKIHIIDFGEAKKISGPITGKDYKRAARDISQYIDEGYTNLAYLKELAKSEIEKRNLN